MIDPAQSTVVAWYDTLPDGLARLLGRLRAVLVSSLGDACVPRQPDQVHATLIGLERASAPFDPGPLAAHLHAMLTPPLTIQFGGFPRTDRRLLSRGTPLHDRGFAVGDGRAVLMGWPVVDGVPGTGVARIRESCAAHGVTHRYGFDPDVYLVIADIGPGVQAEGLETAVRRELAETAVRVPLSAADLSLVTYDDTALPRSSTVWRPLSGAPAAMFRAAPARPEGS
jgi:hypothetical protein